LRLLASALAIAFRRGSDRILVGHETSLENRNG
jgi:hypothetical protein